MNGFGCQIGEFAQSDFGAIEGYFKLDKQLHPDDPEPYAFSFRVLYDVKTRALPPISVGQFKSDALRHSVGIQFTRPAIPVRVWWFDVATIIETEVDPDASRVFSADPGGYYYKEFINPRAGRFYGMSCQWE